MKLSALSVLLEAEVDFGAAVAEKDQTQEAGEADGGVAEQSDQRKSQCGQNESDVEKTALEVHQFSAGRAQLRCSVVPDDVLDGEDGAI